MTESNRPQDASAAERDFAAAIHEIASNLEVRRLMFVVANVIVPALIMAMTDGMAGADYPEETAWLPRHILWIVGVALAVSGVLITTILGRCHFGMVLNGTKMRRAREGELGLAPLNWLGVTTNFILLTALSAGGGLTLALAAFAPFPVAAATGLVLVAGLVLQLRVTHGRANARCEELAKSWDHGAISTGLQEEHARRSLDATTADISVVVTMAVALFAGTFNGMTNLGGIPADLDAAIAPDLLKRHGLPALASFTLLSLLLSARMVVRLRIALAWHAVRLARLRGETDDAYRFSVRERTYLLFLLVQVLIFASSLILAWHFGGGAVGVGVASVVVAMGVIGYPIRLRMAAQRESGAQA